MAEKKKKAFSNSSYRIIAIVLALLLWFYVYQTKNPLTEQVFNVPLQPMNLPTEMVLAETNIQIQVRVQGQKNNLENVQLKDITAYINLANLEAGPHTLRVYATLPDNLQQVSISPATVTINLEEMESTTVPVEVEYLNNLQSSDLRLLDHVLSPVEVVVFGSSSQLSEIETAFIAIDLSTVTESINADYPIRLRDHGGDEITQNLLIEPTSVNLYLPLVSRDPEQNMAVNVPLIGKPADGYQISRITANPAIIQAFGDIQLLMDTKVVDTVPIDVSEATGDISTQVDLGLPTGITSPNQTINVVITIEPVIEKTLSKTMIYYHNTAQELSASNSLEKIDIKISGPQSFIEELNEGAVLPYIDLQGLGEGEYSLPIQVSLPANISLVEVSPKEATVTLVNTQISE